MNLQTAPRKPRFGEPCNGCGYCCTLHPCLLAQELLNCTTGPCVALEAQDERSICGLVRNPLAYLFKVAHPDADMSLLDAASNIEAGKELANDLAAALGVGMGCDSDDSAESAAWPEVVSI